MKSVITDLEYVFESDSRSVSSHILDNESVNLIPVVNPSVNSTLARRINTRFRRRGDTTNFDGPAGAPPLGTASMVGAAGGGPAAWAAAAFGRGDNRKVQKLLLTL